VSLSQTRTAFLSRDSLAASRSLHACTQHRHPRQTNDTPPGIRSTDPAGGNAHTSTAQTSTMSPQAHTAIPCTKHSQSEGLAPLAEPRASIHRTARARARSSCRSTDKLHTHKMLRRLTRTESSPPRKRAASVPTPLLRPARRERRASGASLLRALASASLAPDARRARSILSSCCHECRCNTARHKRTGKLMLTSAPRSRPRTLDSRPSPCSCPRACST
jgi:hypothetical protein